MQGTKELDERFAARKLTHEQMGLQDQLRSVTRRVARFVNANLPDGREKSLALTKLEEFAMWANKGISRSCDEMRR